MVASASLPEQVECLEAALQKNDVAQAVLAVGRDLDLPDWYFGAGGVAQTVWNLLHGFEPAVGIKDYDLVYFDVADLSAESEREAAAEVGDRLRDLGIVVDVKNEARVHLWYEQRFGRHLEPYCSAGEAIASWPTTASSVGVRYHDSRFVVCAPFGLADLFAMVARANKAIVTRDVYEEKVTRWARLWPQLTVLPWSH
ncbi:MAG: nucleotidyltransferase family protein [Actinobacteria bacterium]|nr:nucleotidyltransferase family protein [Actinomycetota bacterium]